jgi:hypothetical protein
MLSNEGVWVVSRFALVVVLVLLAAALRTMVGPSKRRGWVMTAGTLAGLTVGVLTATALKLSLGINDSALFAVGGILLGWAVAWPFARRIPRTAS